MTALRPRAVQPARQPNPSPSPLPPSPAYPDFTFASYPEADPFDPLATGWTHVEDALRNAGGRWSAKRSEVLWRGAPTNDARKRLSALGVSKRRPPGAVPLNVTTIRWRWHCCKAAEAGSRIGDGYVPLAEQCSAKYQVHVAGKSYSAMLKYKLACGSLVLLVEDPRGNEEFWQAALEDGVHVLRVKVRGTVDRESRAGPASRAWGLVPPPH